MCNCNITPCTCGISQSPINCDPCTRTKYCLEKMDSNCVFYHLNSPEEISNLTCLGIPSNTSLTIILEAIDTKLCELTGGITITPLDTNTIDTTIVHTGSNYTISSNVRIDPASTLPYSISSAGLKLDCCNNTCVGVTKAISYTINSINKVSNFYTTLNPNYFTLSDSILKVNFSDTSTLTGDTLSFVKYTIFPLGVSIKTSLNQIMDVPINKCVKDLLNNKYQLIVEINTSKNCYEVIQCYISVEKVPYSERINWAYRWNPQINNLPIYSNQNIPNYLDKGNVYFNDVRFLNDTTSYGSVVRKLNLNTGQLTTIAGKIQTSGLIITQTDSPGDQVGYNILSGVCLDKNEITNNEPAIYVGDFGNYNVVGPCINRIIKETNDKCDERANWKNYVIAGSPFAVAGDVPSVAGTTVLGNVARFDQIYGIKKWFNVNGLPSFLITDAGNNKIKLLYCSDPSLKNVSFGWSVTYFGLTLNTAGVSRNINIDDYGNEKIIIMFTHGQIKVYRFSIINPSLSDLTNLANYTLLWQTGGGLGENDGVAASAQVTDPGYVSKYYDTTTLNYYYLFGNHNGIPTNANNVSQLRKFDINGNFSTLIGANTSPLGLTSTNFTTGQSGFSSGFVTDLQLGLYDLTVGGFRKWDIPNATNTLICGGSSNTSVQTTWVGITQQYMDSQYQFSIQC